MNLLKNLLLTFLAFLFLGAVPATAIPASEAPVAAAVTYAHPALWHVRGKLGDVYLFGSIHVLPPTLQWHTPRIDKAIARADVFVFEVSNEAPSLQRAAALVAAHGLLPPGQDLRSLLAPEAQKDYDSDLALAGLPPMVLANKRPWLAALILTVSMMAKEHYVADSGVDRKVIAIAQAHAKPMRYFETMDQQFALLAPDNDKLEVSEFETSLKEFRSEKDEMGPLVDAWSKGDPSKIDRLMNADLNAYPDAKKALLDDRNKRWVLQIETMLLEKRTFFITVGAGHLAGPLGVPALLRKADYKVIGP